MVIGIIAEVMFIKKPAKTSPNALQAINVFDQLSISSVSQMRPSSFLTNFDLTRRIRHGKVIIINPASKNQSKGLTSISLIEYLEAACDDAANIDAQDMQMIAFLLLQVGPASQLYLTQSSSESQSQSKAFSLSGSVVFYGSSRRSLPSSLLSNEFSALLYVFIF